MRDDDREQEGAPWRDESWGQGQGPHGVRPHGELSCDESRWHDDTVSGTPGSGLFWPTFRYSAIVVAVVVVMAWILGFSADSIYVVAGADAPARQDGLETAAVSPAAIGRREIVVRAGQGGHFILTALVNGEAVRFMVDTGATTVALTPLDAKRVGFDPRMLDYDKRYQTANGIALAAPVTLREVRIGQLSLYDVRATVLSRPMSVSLLGLTFLKRLSGHEVRDGKLVLRW